MNIRVLILEDRPEDADLMVRELHRSGFEPDWRRVESKEDYLASLDSSLDIILADYNLPQFDALSALRLLQDRELDIPFIIVTGAMGDEAAVECIKQGAADYLLKDRMARLGSAVANALEQKKLRHEKRRSEETIRYLAYHDALTNLPNRPLFIDRLTLALAQSKRNKNKKMLAVMFLDLDHFKNINDSLGHKAGDRFLKNVVEQLTKILREGDTIARFGGDEFVLLSADIDHIEDVAKIAKRILDVFKQPWPINGREFQVTTSIGIAICPNDSEDAESLLRYADIALYRAKAEGRNNYQFYNPKMSSEILERLELENSLRQALGHEEFVVHYQPLVNIITKHIVCMEALLRWQHPKRGLLYPDEFIPLAEINGLILPIGEWVLRAACLQNKAWQETGFPAMQVTVNLSAYQFKQKNLIPTIERVLKETGLEAYWLALEITEGIAMENVDYTAKILKSLREMGVGILIDDFGIGYCSLNYLKRLPINALKIDRSFVMDITEDPKNIAIVETIIVLAKSLGLNVIAEGVETENQLALLEEQGCDQMQGYLFSKPISAEELGKILKNYLGLS